MAAGTNLLFRPVNPELDRLKARKGKDAQLPVSDSASVKSGLDGDMSVAGDLEEGGVGKVGKLGFRAKHWGMPRGGRVPSVSV